MHFKYVSMLCSLTALSAALPDDYLARHSLNERDPGTVLTDLKTCESKILQFKSDVSAYSGGASGFVPIGRDLQAILDCCKTATSDCNGSSSFTASQGQTICNYCQNPLETDLAAGLQALINKKAPITSAGLTNQVHQYLSDIRACIKGLCNCLVPHDPVSIQSCQNAICSKFDSDLANALTYF